MRRLSAHSGLVLLIPISVVGFLNKNGKRSSLPCHLQVKLRGAPVPRPADRLPRRVPWGSRASKTGIFVELSGARVFSADGRDFCSWSGNVRPPSTASTRTDRSPDGLVDTKTANSTSRSRPTMRRQCRYVIVMRRPKRPEMHERVDIRVSGLGFRGWREGAVPPEGLL